MTERCVDLAWEATGDPGAPALILCHSLGTDRSMWDDQVVALGAAYRVIRVELRGHGASPAPPGPYSLAELAGDVLGAADAASVQRFAFCGVSIGGMVGLFLAAHHPERVTALIAANTASKIGTLAHWNARIEAVRTTGLAALADGVVARWFAPAFAEAEPARIARARAVFAATSLQGYLGCCEALANADLTADLARIRLPALLIGGGLDVSTPVADLEALQARIAGSKLTVLPGAAHLSNVDSSAAFTSALSDFLTTMNNGR